MHITASTLYDFVQCPTRVALDAYGDATKRDPINPFVRLLWERGTLFERETIAKLDQPFTDLSECNSTQETRHDKKRKAAQPQTSDPEPHVL